MDAAMSSSREYSDLLLEHYRNPRNVGELEDADTVVTVGDPEHGDVMRLSLRIVEGRVSEARFKTFGCAAAIAAGSMTTEIILGKALSDLEEITNIEVATALGGLPRGKVHCSVLAEQALRESVAVYRRRLRNAAEETVVDK